MPARSSPNPANGTGEGVSLPENSGQILLACPKWPDPCKLARWRHRASGGTACLPVRGTSAKSRSWRNFSLRLPAQPILLLHLVSARAGCQRSGSPRRRSARGREGESMRFRSSTCWIVCLLLPLTGGCLYPVREQVDEVICDIAAHPLDVHTPASQERSAAESTDITTSRPP